MMVGNFHYSGTARRGLGVLMREENVASSERVKRQIETGHIRQAETLPLGGSPWNTGADKGTWAGLSLIMQNGVRALMLDTYDFKDEVWLCHSSGGKCNDFTAFVSTLIH